MNARASRLLEQLAAEGLRAALVTKEENIRYLTGYTGEGCLLLLPDRAVIFTDFRYVEQVSRQAPGCECVRTGAGVAPEGGAAALLREAGLARLAYEPYRMTVAQFQAWQEALPGVEFVSLDSKPEALRQVKDAGELESIRRSAGIACAALEKLLGLIRPGMTEREIAAELDYCMLKLGSEGNAFDTIAAAGPNGSLPHAVPGDRPIRKGELLTLDFGAKVNGYCSDMTRTIAIGKVSGELRAMYDAVLEAQLRALACVKPGASCKAVDAAARDYLEAIYPGAFGHGLGHGVGLFIHEGPSFSPRSEASLRPGHVVTVEPGVYIPGLGGVRIEDMVLVTEDGFVNPVTAPKELIQID